MLKAGILTEASLSIGLNFYNSFLLRNVPGFKFPVIYTVHMVTPLLGSTVLIVFSARRRPFAQMRESLLRIALLALLASRRSRRTTGASSTSTSR